MPPKPIAAALRSGDNLDMLREHRTIGATSARAVAWGTR